MKWRLISDPPEYPGYYLGWTPLVAAGFKTTNIRYYGNGEWGNIVGVGAWMEVEPPDPTLLEEALKTL